MYILHGSVNSAVQRYWWSSFELIFINRLEEMRYCLLEEEAGLYRLSTDQ